ncbi:hypothetical protein MRX96_047154 [Rhipicephalus microplus]
MHVARTKAAAEEMATERKASNPAPLSQRSDTDLAALCRQRMGEDPHFAALLSGLPPLAIQRRTTDGRRRHNGRRPSFRTDFYTTRTAVLQVIMRSPPIVLELDRLSAEFCLFPLLKTVRYMDLIVRPEEIIYPAERASFFHDRVTAREATWIAGRRGLHVYTDGSYAERLAGAAYVVSGQANHVEAVERFFVS